MKASIDDHTILLTRTTRADLEQLFEFQTDKEGIHLAAFTAKDPTDKQAYIKKYSSFLADLTIHNCTIRIGNEIVGSIAKFVQNEEAEITYWIDRKQWGKGIATAALRQFLTIEQTRPLHARVAFDNIGSQKVLTHCGFVLTGTDKGFANARGKEIEEYIYVLTA